MSLSFLATNVSIAISMVVRNPCISYSIIMVALETNSMASKKEKRKQYALVQAPKAAKPGFFSRCRLRLKIEAINLPKKALQYFESI